MALSEQKASAKTLLTFLKIVAGRGYHVGEHPAYGGVDESVHRAGSWHGDGLAADINWRGTGSERTRLLKLIPLAESYGLALTFARDGVTGSAANHRDHLHVDCGSWSNYGDGPVPVRHTPPPSEEYDMDRIDLRKAHEKPVEGRHVDQLQGLLLAAGYGPTGLVARHGRPDGIGGRYTRAALGAFQVRTNTGTDNQPDYVAGPKTWVALLKG